MLLRIGPVQMTATTTDKGIDMLATLPISLNGYQPKETTMPDYTPAEMSKLANDLHRAKVKQKMAQDKLNQLKSDADDLEAALLDAMLHSKMESIATKAATISIKRTTFVELTDDRKFFEYVRKNNAFDLVRKQPVIAACKARWDEGVEVPGCKPGTRVDLSITTRR